MAAGDWARKFSVAGKCRKPVSLRNADGTAGDFSVAMRSRDVIDPLCSIIDEECTVFLDL